MADGKVEYVIELLRSGDGAALAAADLQKVDHAAQKSNVSLAGLKHSFEAIAGGLALGAALQHFMEYERALAKLDGALRSTRQYSKAMSDELKELAASLAASTPFGKTDIIDTMGKLLAFGAPKERMRELTMATLDLSMLLGKDLPAATMAMSRALQGEFSMFSRLGIKVDESGSAVANFEEVLKRLSEIAGGQAAAAMDTLSGSVERTQKELAAWNKEIGHAIAQAHAFLAQSFQNLGAGMEPGELLKSLKTQKDMYLGLAEAIRKTVLARQDLTAAEKGELLARVSVVENMVRYSLPQTGELDEAALAQMRGAQTGIFPTSDRMLRTLANRAGGVNVFGEARATGQMMGPPVPSPLLEKDRVAMEAKDQAEFDAFLELAEKLREEEAKDLAEREKAQQEAIKRRFENERAVSNAERDLKNQTTLAGLEGIAREREQLRIQHEERVSQIQQLKFEDEDRYINLMAMEGRLYEVESKRFEREHSAAGKLQADMKMVQGEAEQAFASGLAGAMVNAFSDGEQAFKKFAATFLKQIAQMILQQLILNALQAGMRSLGIMPVTGASGVMVMGAGGVAGVREVTGPTYFPQFNVLAGEAGREVMTVLARPRMVNVGGIPAQVGNVGPHRLAIVSASALNRLAPRRWAGGGSTIGSDLPSGNGVGQSEVLIRLEPGLKAEITKSSIEGARVRVVQDMSADTTLSRATRRLQA